MENYPTLKTRQQEEFNALPIKWAFSDKQLKQALSEMGLTEDDLGKLVKIHGGGLMLRTEVHLLHEIVAKHTKEMNEAIKRDRSGEGFIFEMFNYELGNHEYCDTGDFRPALDALGMCEEDIKENQALGRGLWLVIKAQRRS